VKVPVIIGAPLGSSERVVKFTLPWRTCIVCFLSPPLLLGLEVCPWNDFLGWGQFLMKCDELPQLKQRLLLFPWLNCGKFGLHPNYCCCYWGWGTGGLLNLDCWGCLATHLLDWLFWCGARGDVFLINRYLGGWALEGPVGIFHFFSARWPEMQSSWVIAMLTSLLKVSILTRFSRSLSLVFRPWRKRSRFLASVFAW
jgi:hypothetical protein